VKVLRIHEGARRDANLAIVWYAERSMSLARRFRDELLSAYSASAESPSRYPSYLHGTRRFLLRKFPYSIVFLEWQDEIFVVAVAHAKRRPGYWRKRI
jgi:plasmid stabilization system protein ParE